MAANDKKSIITPKDKFINLLNTVRNKRIMVILETTVREFNRDNSSLLAAAVSYYLLFSLFPLALAIISIAGFVLQSLAFQEQLINSLAILIPVARNTLFNTMEGIISTRTATGIVAFLGLIFSALAFFSALRRALNTAWGNRQSYPFLKGQLLDLTMMVVALILILMVMWASTVIGFIQDFNFAGTAGRFLGSRLFSRLVFVIVSFITASAIILLLYKFVPDQRPRWKDIWPGALLAAAVLEVARYGFLWYVKNYGQYNIIYGSVGSIIALLAFVYIFVYILLFIARLTAVRLRMNREAMAI